MPGSLVHHGLRTLFARARRRSPNRQRHRLPHRTGHGRVRACRPVARRGAPRGTEGVRRSGRGRDDVRDDSMWIWWERLGHDVHYSLRGFRRTPGFAVAACCRSPSASAANTAIFSLFNALVLKPVPVQDPGSLYQVMHAGDAGTFESSTYAFYRHVKGRIRSRDRRVAGGPAFPSASWSTARPMRPRRSASPATTTGSSASRPRSAPSSSPRTSPAPRRTASRCSATRTG